MQTVSLAEELCTSLLDKSPPRWSPGVAMMAPRHIAALFVALTGVAANPGRLECNRPVVVDAVIMGQAAIFSSEVATTFDGGKSCGGIYTAGEDIVVSVIGGGMFLLTVEGATIPGADCDGTRTEIEAVLLDTSESTGDITAWIGRAASGAGPVTVHEKCTLTQAAPVHTDTGCRAAAGAAIATDAAVAAGCARRELLRADLW